MQHPEFLQDKVTQASGYHLEQSIGAHLQHKGAECAKGLVDALLSYGSELRTVRSCAQRRLLRCLAGDLHCQGSATAEYAFLMAGLMVRRTSLFSGNPGQCRGAKICRAEGLLTCQSSTLFLVVICRATKHLSVLTTCT